MARFAKGDRVRIMSSGKYGGRVGEVLRYEPVIDSAGGYPYVVRVGEVTGAFKADHLQKLEDSSERL